MTLEIILMGSMVICAAAAVFTARLLMSVVFLAGASAALTIIMFRMDAPIAGVFELSVCAGLIPAIFISAISFTRRLTTETLEAKRRDRLRRFWPMALLIVLAAIALTQVNIPMNFALPAAPAAGNVQNVLWEQRHMDLLGQIVILVAAALAVVVLVKEPKRG